MQSVKRWVKKNFGGWIYGHLKSSASKTEMENWLSQFRDKSLPLLSEASYNVFTYHGEDGILLYLLTQLTDVPKTFVDIGAGDCIKSNCANLAVHYNWDGVFIDQSKQQLDVGRQFYKREILKGAFLKFLPETVVKENVNTIIRNAGISGNIGLLSIDIDGNDYWIWETIDNIQPEIVIIEAKVEFGNRSIAVPFNSGNHHSADQMYNGASVEALRRLGVKKGYKLAGANKQGYNLFFVKENYRLPAETTGQILANPETISSFYPESFFTEHIFESI